MNSEVSPTSSGYGSNGIFSFLWIALTAGFAALLTPCVFPMIPLTVSFFSKQKEGEGYRAIGQALGFGAAIVLTFTILGALLALFIGASGANQFAANPWVNLFIALVLVVFAVSLLGAFELRLPHQLTNWLNQKSNESSGFVGVLFMALTISAVSFSCTAPFVGGVLAATTGGQWFYPILGMAGFSTAFASPFVVFALFPRWLESLPKSGSWMNIVKVLLGFIELAAAVKFLSNADLVWQWGLVSRPFAIAAWIAIFLLAGFYVLGIYSINNDSRSKQIGTGRLMLALPFILFSFYLIPGLMGASLGIWDAWLPPKQATDVSVVQSLAQQGGTGMAATTAKSWSSNYEEAKETAQKENKPLFIDFTGYTCTNCRAMETNVFPLKRYPKTICKNGASAFIYRRRN
ncbi:MAG: cytochrome c biogenesis protein CcdA [Fodinibius sp.]|nr:cytochrome c biogenesis protein CcdA [Fodinibius sp.]